MKALTPGLQAVEKGEGRRKGGHLFSQKLPPPCLPAGTLRIHLLSWWVNIAQMWVLG